MIFKTKKRSGLILAVIFLITLLMVFGGGIFLYLSKKNEGPQENLPPIIKQMAALNEDIRTTTIDIYDTSAKLAGISMVQSRITDIESTIKLIDDSRQLIEKNKTAIDRLIEFIDGHSAFVYRKNLTWIFAIKAFYADDQLAEHNKSRTDYYAAFETLLKYTHANFKNIMEIKSQQHLKSYDIYYMRYRRVADNHNRVNKKRIEFQTGFVEEHPEVKSFLPGGHQNGSFKFWDKFSF